MNATHLIERATRAHTSDGYTSYPALCSSLEAIVRDLCAELNVLQGVGQTAASGCHHATLALGDASALVEYEVERAERQTAHHPGRPASVSILRVFINGHWCEAEDAVPAGVIERWGSELLEAHDDDEQAAADIAAEARADERRERAWVEAA